MTGAMKNETWEFFKINLSKNDSLRRPVFIKTE